MSEQKQSSAGRYSVVIGIAAGFVFLLALLATLKDGWGRFEALTVVAIVTTSISIFLVLTEAKKTKRCQSPRH